jgi:hypothetical protein
MKAMNIKRKNEKHQEKKLGALGMKARNKERKLGTLRAKAKSTRGENQQHQE